MLVDHDKVVVVWLDVSTAFGHEHVNAWLDEPWARHRGGMVSPLGDTAVMMLYADTGKMDIPFVRDRALWEKSACRQDHRAVQRSSAKVEKRMDGHNCAKKEVAAPDQSKRW